MEVQLKQEAFDIPPWLDVDSFLKSLPGLAAGSLQQVAELARAPPPSEVDHVPTRAVLQQRLSSVRAELRAAADARAASGAAAVNLPPAYAEALCMKELLPRPQAAARFLDLLFTVGLPDGATLMHMVEQLRTLSSAAEVRLLGPEWLPGSCNGMETGDGGRPTAADELLVYALATWANQTLSRWQACADGQRERPFKSTTWRNQAAVRQPEWYANLLDNAGTPECAMAVAFIARLTAAATEDSVAVLLEQDGARLLPVAPDGVAQLARAVLLASPWSHYDTPATVLANNEHAIQLVRRLPMLHLISLSRLVRCACSVTLMPCGAGGQWPGADEVIKAELARQRANEKADDASRLRHAVAVARARCMQSIKPDPSSAGGSAAACFSPALYIRNVVQGGDPFVQGFMVYDDGIFAANSLPEFTTTTTTTRKTSDGREVDIDVVHLVEAAKVVVTEPRKGDAMATALYAPDAVPIALVSAYTEARAVAAAVAPGTATAAAAAKAADRARQALKGAWAQVVDEHVEFIQKHRQGLILDQEEADLIRATVAGDDEQLWSRYLCRVGPTGAL
jgi:hypothetical protein